MIIKNIPTRSGIHEIDGRLCICESATEAVPFAIKRVYYTYEVKAGITRGNHAHKNLEQILICVHGAIKVTLDDGNKNTETIILNDPSIGIYVGPHMWRTMKWMKDDSVLLVLASNFYDASDYIRDYDEFLTYIAHKA